MGRLCPARGVLGVVVLLRRYLRRDCFQLTLLLLLPCRCRWLDRGGREELVDPGGCLAGPLQYQVVTARGNVLRVCGAEDLLRR